LGDSDEARHRHGGGPRRVHLSESEHELVDGRPELRGADIHAFLRMDQGAQNGHVLFEKKGTPPAAAVHD